MNHLFLDRLVNQFIHWMGVLIFYILPVLSIISITSSSVTEAYNFWNSLWEDKWNLRLEIPPKENFEDLITDNREYLEAPDSFASLNRWFSILNQTIWVFVAPIFMIVLIYAGYLMVTSQWNADQMKKWINVLVYAWAALWIILLSYVLVNLVVNLF
jgi:hypothetical protein